MKRNNHRKIKNYWINPKFQMRFLLLLLLSGGGLGLSLSFLFYTYVKENYMLLVDLSPMSDEAKVQLYTELNEMVIKCGGITVIYLFLISILAIIISHRAAGPLYHFKTTFSKIASGDRSSRIRLRPSDDFQDVAVEFNKMMETLK